VNEAALCGMSGDLTPAGQLESEGAVRYDSLMNRVEEIARAIKELNPDEFAEVARWVQEVQQERWDQQLDRDASAGRLDFLREEAQTEEKGQLLRDWP